MLFCKSSAVWRRRSADRRFEVLVAQVNGGVTVGVMVRSTRIEPSLPTRMSVTSSVRLRSALASACGADGPCRSRRSGSRRDRGRRRQEVPTVEVGRRVDPVLLAVDGHQQKWRGLPAIDGTSGRICPWSSVLMVTNSALMPARRIMTASS